jgi:hypothetical protein
MLQNSRIKALLLEVRWDFESSQLDRLARILIGAQSVRLEVINAEPSLRAIVHDPFVHDRDQLMEAYSQLEDARNLIAARAKDVATQSTRVGLAVPEVIRQRTNESIRSLEIWMATIGSAIAKNGREHGAFIWSRLKESRGELSAALQQLRKIEQELGNTMFDAADGKIISVCTYVPVPYE